MPIALEIVSRAGGIVKRKGTKMNKVELAKALELSKTRKVSDPTDISIFAGFALRDFRPIHTTIDAVAALINWQCLQFNGQYDLIALDEIASHGRKKFIIIG